MGNYLLLTGCARSGTSALVKLLNFDSRILMTDEFGTFHDFNSNERYKKLMVWPRLKEEHRRAYKGLLQKGINPKNFLEVLEERKPDGAGIFNILEELSNQKFKIMGDKAPLSYLNNLDSILNSLPNNVKVIFTMRDGRDVMASQIRTFNKQINNNFGVDPWCYPDVETAEPMWLNSTRQILNYVEQYPSNFFIARYEALVTNKKQELFKIQEFLGLPVKEIDDGGWYKPTHFNAWKSEFPNMKFEISDAFKHYLTLAGYEV